MLDRFIKLPKEDDPEEVDLLIGNVIVEVKFGVDAIRTFRSSILQVAIQVGASSVLSGYLVLVNSLLASDRVKEEWRRISGVLCPDVRERITICMASEGGIVGLLSDLPFETQRMLMGVIDSVRGKEGGSRTDYAFVILKLLIHQWFVSGEAVTADWLARTAGCHYPAVARALRLLGGLIERTSDRRICLRWFPRDEFARMVATADRARSTVRFADMSGRPRSAGEHLRRLEKIETSGLAIGGVLGAQRIFPALDLVGSPRLDLSMHCPGKQMKLDFIKELDPALKPVTDPLQPATVVVHAVRHADSLFSPRDGGLAWADSVECLLDLYEGKLEIQASQFLEYLESVHPMKK